MDFRPDIPLESDTCKLEFRWRMAWATSLVERVLSYYSQYASKLFRHFDVIDYVWLAIVDSPSNVYPHKEEMEFIVHDIAERISKHTEYEDHFRFLGGRLFHEMLNKSGFGASLAVSDSAMCFGDSQLFAQGVGLEDEIVRSNYRDKLAQPFFELSWTMFDLAHQWQSERELERGIFDTIQFNPEIELLPVELLNQVTERPPKHEWEYRKQENKDD